MTPESRHPDTTHAPPTAQAQAAAPPPDPGPNPLALTAEALAARADDLGLSPNQARSAYRRLYRQGHDRRLSPLAPVAPIVRTLEDESPEGPVIKFVQRLTPPPARPGKDPFPHLDIESVIIPMLGRRGVRKHTLCVSSQVGCAMGCEFCETAQMGLIRSLTPQEIVGQWFAATHTLGAHIDNIVFMGMGEPLDNTDNVIAAIEVLTDHNGPAVPASKITVSTVGRVDGIQRLAEHTSRPGWHRLGLALSLNAPDDETRARIMPINRRYPMDELRRALTNWPIHAGFKLCIEYVLIPGVNDTHAHAQRLADWVLGDDDNPRLPAMINVIPYNPRRNSPWPAPDEHSVDTFVNTVRDRRIMCKRRRTKGRAMMAACGQLGTAEIRQRRYTPLRVENPA